VRGCSCRLVLCKFPFLVWDDEVAFDDADVG
jgi:hypothetical protein